MIEVLFLALAAALLHFFGVVWWTMAFFVLVFLFVAPGLYSLLFGAPYVPTNKTRIDALMELAQFDKDDVVYDLGCGDGRVVRAIADRGVKRVVGFEYSLPTYFLAKIWGWIVRSSSTINYANFWNQDFEDATVIFVFLMTEPMKRFEKEIWPKLKSGTKVISNEFRLTGVKPSKTENFVHLYVKN